MMPAKYVELPASPRETAALSYRGMEALLYDVNGKRILRRKIANNTWLERTSEGIGIRLHRTYVIVWHRDNTITLNTDGWYTITTKERMNRWLPRWPHGRRDITIFSDRGYWHVSFRRNGYHHDKKWIYPFHDGMMVDLATASPLSPRHDLSEDRAHNEVIEKLIRSYMRSAPENPCDFSDTYPDNDGFYVLDGNEEDPMYAEINRDMLLRCLDERFYHRALVWLVARDRALSNGRWADREQLADMANRIWSHLFYRMTFSDQFRRDLRKLFRSYLYKGAHGKVRLGKR